jgi:hypothetical protein
MSDAGVGGVIKDVIAPGGEHLWKCAAVGEGISVPKRLKGVNDVRSQAQKFALIWESLEKIIPVRLGEEFEGKDFCHKTHLRVDKAYPL